MELEEKTGVSSGKTANPHWPTAGLLDYVQLMTTMIMRGERDMVHAWSNHACMLPENFCLGPGQFYVSVIPSVVA